MKKFAFIMSMLVASVYAADPAPVKTNPEVERLVQQRMVKYDRWCARSTGPGDMFTCYRKHWDELATDVQGYAFQISRSKAQINPLWYAEFETRYYKNPIYRNCHIRYGQYNPMKSPDITACLLREYAYLEVMVEQHNKGTWKSTPVNTNPTVAQRKKADAYFNSIPETNSEDYEGD